MLLGLANKRELQIFLLVRMPMLRSWVTLLPAVLFTAAPFAALSMFECVGDFRNLPDQSHDARSRLEDEVFAV